MRKYSGYRRPSDFNCYKMGVDRGCRVGKQTLVVVVRVWELLFYRGRGVVKRTKAQGLGENVQAIVRDFCATARARFEGCTDMDATRQFLRDHIQAIIFSHGSIAIVGTIAEAQLPFRIEDQIDRAAIRLNSALRGSKAALEARLKTPSLPVRSISAGGRVPLAFQ